MAANTPKASTLYKNYTNINKNKPGAFKYNDKNLKNYYDKLMNRKDFSFDLNGNALYQQYKDQFTKQGQMAMMDTMGQASALTGGYGNSYAQTAGQQVYQQNLSQLTDKIPELYQLALNQYQMEGDNLQNLYGVASNERDFAYGQHRDKVSDWYNDRDFSYNAYTDQRDYEYQQGRDKVADTHWAKEFGLESDKFDWQKTMDNKNYNLDLSRFNWDKTMDTKNYNLDKDRFGWEKDRALTEDNQWLQSHNLDVNRLNETIRQYDQDSEHQQQRDKTTDEQWQKELDFKNRQLDETIRSNKASEDLASKKSSSNNNRKKTKTPKQSKKEVKSPQDFANNSATIVYQNLGRMGKAERIDYITEAFIKGEINQKEAEYLKKVGLELR